MERLDSDTTAQRVRALKVARRRATALLAAATALFVAVTASGLHGTAIGYVEAGAQAAMIGGVADWFAVTALFRHPLGIPIPHTALLVERKDQFAATLGRFVQENFLNAEVLTERVRSARLVPRLAAWLSDEANAARFAAQAADMVVEVAEVVREEDVQRVFMAELGRALDAVEVAPLAGRGLRLVTSGQGNTELFDAIIAGLDRYLVDHQAELRERYVAESSHWVPHAVDRLVFDRLHSRFRKWLAAMVADPDSEGRREFARWIADLADRLETSPQLRARGEQLKHDLLSRAELRDWSSSLWEETKASLRAQAAQPDSDLRRRIAGGLAAAGRRLDSDPRLQESLERVAESGTRALASQFHDELAGLVTGTIDRWDATETARQLELLLGRDLQFIRINGTIVGAAVGLILHAMAQGLA
jgi:uncharacterized membrane-anchored protein YjiN (DUF445 family)